MRALFRRISRLWMAFAHALGWVNSRILLTVLYVVILGPFALVRRVGSLFARRNSPASYWLPKRSEEPTIASLRRIF